MLALSFGTYSRCLYGFVAGARHIRESVRTLNTISVLINTHRVYRRFDVDVIVDKDVAGVITMVETGPTFFPNSSR